MNRYLVLQIAVVVLLGILLIRLFSIQVVDDSYRRYAFNNVLQRNVQYPPRGEVLDRREKEEKEVTEILAEMGEETV